MAPHKLNCWEFMNCGREPGGVLAAVEGVCPVPKWFKLDGANDGIAAGRACWMVVDNGCHRHGRACHTCQFYRRVVFEQEEACHVFSSCED
ncbi:MAG: hypothetical protein D6800_06885 [Candidatus Zixiibacteriota bacterium]|nr:MAG: hypothetical protein D6800_06885 [candidate division Zixibacteria bacterium]